MRRRRRVLIRDVVLAIVIALVLFAAWKLIALVFAAHEGGPVPLRSARLWPAHHKRAPTGGVLVGASSRKGASLDVSIFPHRSGRPAIYLTI